MRAVFDALERLVIRFITGSVAASVYGVLRQSHDTDIVLDLEVGEFGPLASALRSTCAVAEPIDYGAFAMASAIEQSYLERWAARLGVTDRLREVGCWLGSSRMRWDR